MIVNRDPVVVNVVQIPFANDATVMVAGMKVMGMVVTFAIMVMVPAVMAMMPVSQGWCGCQTHA